ncbi:MAG: LPS-assembly protein LptD, partial [Planctomycetes bacterium]|nr:LPS-assembly protein LptD [Planctomycetota bacterium]
MKVEKNESEEDILATGPIDAIYLAGDVILTEGQRIIRTDEMYYDFRQKKAIAVNSVMRTFDPKRGIPIYVRAYKLRQVSENQFAAENVVITSSEFHQPQISLEASSVYIADTTTIDEEIKDSSYDAQMRDIRMKMGKRTIFYWPYLRSNLERPDLPLKSVRFGQNSRQGTSVETRWYLAKLMGWKEPEGTDSTLAVDYFSKRGVGVGTLIEYEKGDYYGRLLNYIINDSGKDKLGRHATRDNADNEGFRGRFDWQHRQFLPYNWQLTTGISYVSDKNFIESYYRSEFSVGNYRETYVHLKRIEDNWALSFLVKPRLNDFADQLEELPSAEFHLTGQSLFDDTVTMYSDSEFGRLRQRIGDDNRTLIDENHFTFGYNRTELDIPLRADPFKIVPFVAGTFAFDDRSGFRRTLVDGQDAGRFGSEAVFIGEGGIRIGTQFHKVYPNVKSRLWDLNQLRHIVRPELTVVGFAE